MLRTNERSLPIIALQGTVSRCKVAQGGELCADRNRQGRMAVMTGSIVYNYAIGDCCMGISADHVEPGVTSQDLTDEYCNGAYNVYSCVGNKVRVISGDAKGAEGFVTGKHGDFEHVMLSFKRDVLEKLTLDDKFLIHAWGYGLELLDYPQVKAINLAPDLLHKMVQAGEDGSLTVPAAAVVPCDMMGSGIGHGASVRGDFDIMTGDWQLVCRHGLDKLRFGDIVVITDCDCTFGFAKRKGAVSVGVVAHSDSKMMGHGPGITLLMSCKTPVIKGIYSSSANLAEYL